MVLMKIAAAIFIIILAWAFGHYSGYKSRRREVQDLKDEIRRLKRGLQEQKNRVLDTEYKLLSGEDDDDF